tara:strand:- start:106 stop:249 length:144 start_codon:yes stop_codon:yes gene_type:complete
MGLKLVLNWFSGLFFSMDGSFLLEKIPIFISSFGRKAQDLRMEFQES